MTTEHQSPDLFVDIGEDYSLVIRLAFGDVWHEIPCQPHHAVAMAMRLYEAAKVAIDARDQAGRV